MPHPFRFDRTWRFDVTVEELWSALVDTASYPAIWSWLRDYEAGPLRPGTVARFRVRPPLPYSLHLVVTIDDVVPGERVDATVGGDVRGDAHLVLSAAVDAGSQARLRWELDLVRPTLLRVEPVARPMMVWGHDLVVAMGVQQFRRKAL